MNGLKGKQVIKLPKTTASTAEKSPHKQYATIVHNLTAETTTANVNVFRKPFQAFIKHRVQSERKYYMLCEKSCSNNIQVRNALSKSKFNSSGGHGYYTNFSFCRLICS